MNVETTLLKMSTGGSVSIEIDAGAAATVLTCARGAVVVLDLLKVGAEHASSQAEV